MSEEEQVGMFDVGNFKTVELTDVEKAAIINVINLVKESLSRRIEDSGLSSHEKDASYLEFQDFIDDVAFTIFGLCSLAIDWL